MAADNESKSKPSGAKPGAAKEGQFINPPNYLKMKVGEGGFDKQAIKEAEAAVQALGQKMYSQWAETDLDRIRTAYDQLRTTDVNDIDGVRAMLRICWDMKGLGGTFGYPLVTEITHFLSNYLEYCLETEGAKVSTAVVTPHIDALYVVLSQKIAGDGGAIGQELVRGLEKVVLKTGARIGGRG